ncbi:MAG TPA: type II CAAX endopeptidase family protein [Kofleriaceae bacterium]|nr:type II CAAX endopeptidase family protein [Kofleriaceae bacterium]
MTTGRRILAFPVVRIVLAAAPIVGVIIVANALALPVLLASVVVPLLYVAYVRIVERRPVSELAAAGAGRELLQGFTLGAALFAITMVVLCLAGIATVARGDGWLALASGLGVAIAAALVEETLMRAIFFRIVEESLGTVIALVASAALFGFLHAFNPGATVVSTIAIALEAGIILAAAYLYTRRLWMAIGLHTAWNFTEGGVFGASVSGTTPHGLFTSHFSGPPILSGGTFGPEASVVAVVVCLLAGVALLVRAQRLGRFRPPFWAKATAR